MVKKILLVAFLIFCTLSQYSTRVGGYATVDPTNINSLEEMAELKRIELFARQQYAA